MNTTNLRLNIRNLRRGGSSLAIAMVTLAILSFAIAAIAVSVSTTANVSLQAASWQEAELAAEAGADYGMGCFRAALDDYNNWAVSTNALTDPTPSPTASPVAWSGWAKSDPWAGGATYGNATMMANTTVLRASTSVTPGLQALVTVEAPKNWTTTGSDGATRQWYRVRSTGVAGTTGVSRTGADKRDNELRKISLIRMRDYGLQPFNSPSPYPTVPLLSASGGQYKQVTRSVELIVQPLASGLWDRAITATAPTGGGAVNLGASFTIDSYDSTDPTKSGTCADGTSGCYTVSKRQSNADLASDANGSYVNIGGAHLYGDVSTNGGTAKATQNVTGTVSNNFYEAASDIATPSWANTNTNTSITTSTPASQLTLNGGSSANHATYSYGGVTLKGQTLTCAYGTTNGQNDTSKSYIDIYVGKDFSMSNSAQWIVNSGMHVTVYIVGQFSVDGSSTVANQTNQAANLSLYGIAPKPGVNPQWQYNGVSDFTGTVYAPEVKFKVTGSANFFGAVISYSFDSGGTSSAGFHFDESLLKGGGGTPRYQVASWIEDVR